MEEEKKLSIYKVNILYLTLSIIFLSVGGFTQNQNLFLGILVTEILIIAIPSIFFVSRNNISFRRAFRLNKLGLRNTILIFFITIFSYPIAAYFQGLFIGILSIFIDLKADPLPDIISQIPFLWSILFIAIVPGICEEIMFRGPVLRAYEKLGIKKAILISGLLFGLFHFTLINFVGPAVLGIIFGIMVYKTNSIYSSMLAHTLNNSIALTISHFLTKYIIKNEEFINDLSTQEMDLSTNISEMIISFAIMGIFIFILIMIVKALLNKLSLPISEGLEQIENQDRVIEETYMVGEKVTFSTYIPLLIVVIMFVIFNFIFILR